MCLLFVKYHDFTKANLEETYIHTSLFMSLF